MTRIGTGNTSYADLRSNVKEYNQTIKDLPFERVDRLTASFVVGTTELQRNGTVTPTISFITCEVMANVHSFCETEVPTLAVMACVVISNVHLFCKLVIIASLN